MYQQVPFNGAGLPPKTLCLTFDDGPGAFTLQIARFLFEQNIRATFFVVGKYAFHHPEILKQLKQMNHLIGNHTYDHPDLPYYVSADGDILDQVLRTDAVIKPYIDGEYVFFRAPYGKWSAEVAQALNKSILTAHHIGPVHWEISGIDCYYWLNNRSVADAAEWYMHEIERSGSGIVVMHDEIADMDMVKPENKTLELVKTIIPQLLKADYRFVRLDEIPSVKTALAAPFNFTLRDHKGRYVSLKNKFDLYAEGKPENINNLLQLQMLGFGKLTIKAANNCYVSAPADTEKVTASGAVISSAETFDLIPVRDNNLMLRCTNGHYLSVTKSGEIGSGAQHMRQATIFKYVGHNLPVKEAFSLKQKLVQIQKQLLFIKSKLIQKISG